MIVFVNGPFGVGKSTIVRLLAERLPDALTIDPEVVGHMLWAQLPAELRAEEFELEPVWAPVTRCLIEEAARTYGRTLLVPMTLARTDPFERIVGGLRRAGLDVRHFTLLAAAEEIRRRLRSRMLRRGETADQWGELSWEGLQVRRCLESLTRSEFAQHVWTDERTPHQVADHVHSLLDTGHGRRTPLPRGAAKRSQREQGADAFGSQ